MLLNQVRWYLLPLSRSKSLFYSPGVIPSFLSCSGFPPLVTVAFFTSGININSPFLKYVFHYLLRLLFSFCMSMKIHKNLITFLSIVNFSSRMKIIILKISSNIAYFAMHLMRKMLSYTFKFCFLPDICRSATASFPP